jgi:mannose-6-phosphate isomerase-like protein (cupin superfamily)
MPNTSFIITGDRAAIVANDIADLRYRAAVQYLPSGMQMPIRSNDTEETLIYVDEGTLEFMVGGPSGFAGAGAFVRVPKGVPFAYRNCGNGVARLLVRVQSPNSHKGLKVTLEFAA